jgi:hypothetical protein
MSQDYTPPQRSPDLFDIHDVVWHRINVLKHTKADKMTDRELEKVVRTLEHVQSHLLRTDPHTVLRFLVERPPASNLNALTAAASRSSGATQRRDLQEAVAELQWLRSAVAALLSASEVQR